MKNHDEPRYQISIVLVLRSLLRMPAYWVPTLLFPVLLFGVIGSHESPGLPTTFAMASFAAYAVIGVGFYQFGVSIAMDRETQWERYRRTLPGATGPRIVSQITVGTVFAFAAVLLVIAGGFLMMRPDADANAIVRLIIASLAIAPPFTLIGIALGYLTSAKASVPVANLVFLPFAYLGGLWTPPGRLPETVAAISPWLPTRHAGEIVWATVGPQPFPWESIWILVGYSVLFIVVVAWAYNRDERQRYA
ncbi:MAG: ABC transporter permease [Rhodospirillaceae bacterium]|nr:ABC transporter permease [Rhodospirillaceae bacterium]